MAGVFIVSPAPSLRSPLRCGRYMWVLVMVPEGGKVIGDSADGRRVGLLQLLLDRAPARIRGRTLLDNYNLVSEYHSGEGFVSPRIHPAR